MKSLLLASVLSFLLIPHFSYADNIKNTWHEHHQHHIQSRHHARSHPYSKSNDIQPVDINHADVAQLSSLKGIGQKKAVAIVAYRVAHGPFKTVSDLAKVKGIGIKAVARLEAKNPDRLVVNIA